MIPKSAILLLAIFLTAAIAGAQTPNHPPNYLEPEVGNFSGYGSDPYYYELRKLLLGEHPYRLCQMLVFPIFGPEWAVYLIREDTTKGETQVIYKSLKKRLWHELSTLFEKDSISGKVRLLGPEAQTAALAKADISVNRSIVSISEPITALLEQVWTEMLARVSYPKKDEIRAMADWDDYHFSHYIQEIGFRSGTTKSPGKGTNALALVELAEELRQYALADEKDRPQIETTIISKAKSLLEKLE